MLFHETSNAPNLSNSWYVWLTYRPPCFFADLVTESGSARANPVTQRPVRDAARGLYALAHHTEAETATQGDIKAIEILVIST